MKNEKVETLSHGVLDPETPVQIMPIALFSERNRTSLRPGRRDADRFESMIICYKVLRCCSCVQVAKFSSRRSSQVVLTGTPAVSGPSL